MQLPMWIRFSVLSVIGIAGVVLLWSLFTEMSANGGSGKGRWQLWEPIETVAADAMIHSGDVDIELMQFQWSNNLEGYLNPQPLPGRLWCTITLQFHNNGPIEESFSLGDVILVPAKDRRQYDLRQEATNAITGNHWFEDSKSETISIQPQQSVRLTLAYYVPVEETELFVQVPSRAFEYDEDTPKRRFVLPAAELGVAQQ